VHRRPDEVGDQGLGDLSTCTQLPAVSNTAYTFAASIPHCPELNPTNSEVAVSATGHDHGRLLASFFGAILKPASVSEYAVIQATG
jgi:hypothetical protein